MTSQQVLIIFSWDDRIRNNGGISALYAKKTPLFVLNCSLRPAYEAMERLYDITTDTSFMTMNTSVQGNMLKMFNTTDRTILDSLTQQVLIN